MDLKGGQNEIDGIRYPSELCSPYIIYVCEEMPTVRILDSVKKYGTQDKTSVATWLMFLKCYISSLFIYFPFIIKIQRHLTKCGKKILIIAYKSLQ